MQTWLDTVLELPWSVRTEDAYDVPGDPRACSTPTTPGLDEVKDRITESLSFHKRREERGLGPSSAAGGAGPSWPWSGRPASARRRWASRWPGRIGRKFVRVALGGVRDEAEIRGHRRTYVGPPRADRSAPSGKPAR